MLNPNSNDFYGQNNAGGENGQGVGSDQEEVEMTEQEILGEFDNMLNTDPALQEMLGEFLQTFSLEDKVAMIHAYKKGGVEGLAEIIDDDDEEDDEAKQRGQFE